MAGRIVYGPDWPDPQDVVGFLEQVLQFTRSAIADDRPFTPQRAIVLLVDDRDGGYELADVAFPIESGPAIVALELSADRFKRSLDPNGRFEPE